EDHGVLVAKVFANSPADRGGIRAGDVIHQINGQGVTEAAAVQEAVDASQIGQVLKLELTRNGQTLHLAVKPGALPAAKAS
ncbi:PDZ domain-containing protein, partial [Lyngbya confervoides]